MDKTYQLLLDGSGEYTYIYLICNDKLILDKFINKNNKDLSIKLNDYVNLILNKNHIDIKNINKLYLVYGPGKFSGMRICSDFVKTLKILFDHLKIFILDRFHYLNLEQNLIILNADGNKYFISILNNQKTILEPKIINKSQLDQILEIKNKKEYEIILDYRNDDLNIINNLIYFKEVNEDFKLEYLKDF